MKYRSGTLQTAAWWGPRFVEGRAAVLGDLTGAKVPKSKAGFNAFRTALYVAVGLDGSEGSPAALEKEFARRAAEVAGG